MNTQKQHTPPRREVKIVIIHEYHPCHVETKWAHVVVRGCSDADAIRAAKRLIERRWNIPRQYLRAPFIHQSVT